MHIYPLYNPYIGFRLIEGTCASIMKWEMPLGVLKAIPGWLPLWGVRSGLRLQALRVRALGFRVRTLDPKP